MCENVPNLGKYTREATGHKTSYISAKRTAGAYRASYIFAKRKPNKAGTSYQTSYTSAKIKLNKASTGKGSPERVFIYSRAAHQIIITSRQHSLQPNVGSR
jgi:hypothetical protein